jgi:hypothetical protein
VVELTPAKVFHNQDPGAREPNTAEVHQVRYLLMTRRHRRLQTLPLLGFQSPDLFVHQSQACLFPSDLCLQVRWERGTVPEPGSLQALQEVVVRLQADPLGY